MTTGPKDLRYDAQNAEQYAQAAVYMALITGDDTELDRLLREDLTRDQLIRMQHLTSKISQHLWNARAARSVGLGAPENGS